MLEAQGITRHVQLKASTNLAKTADQKIHLSLAAKPSGCVVWTHFDPETLDLGPFLFFGGTPGTPLPPLTDFRVAKHSKANAMGEKLERPNLRVVRRSQFKHIESIAALYEALFNPVKQAASCR